MPWCWPLLLSRGHTGVLDQRTRTAESSQVSGLGQDRRGADRGQSVDRGDELGQAELVQDSHHPVFDVGEPSRGVLPVRQDEAGTFQRSGAMRDNAVVVGEGLKHGADDPQVRSKSLPLREFSTDGSGEARFAESSKPARVARAPLQHDGQRGAPRLGPERARRGVEHGRPDALEQVPQLLHRARRVGRQRCPSGAQVPQPSPRGVDALGLVAATLRSQPSDERGVFRIGLVPGEVLGFAGSPDEQRLHTDQRKTPVGGELVQHSPAVTGRFARDCHGGEAGRVGSLDGPVEQ